jgi:acyl carrier protein
MEVLNDFVNKFKTQYVDSDQFDMGPDTSFRQVGSWDSLTGMAVLVMIHDEYGIDIPMSEFRELATVKEVYNYILSNNNKK